jgi:hypothetical protein
MFCGVSRGDDINFSTTAATQVEQAEVNGMVNSFYHKLILFHKNKGSSFSHQEYKRQFARNDFCISL